MKHPHPLELWFAACVLGALAAATAGLFALAGLLGLAALGSLARSWIRQNADQAQKHRRPSITYLAEPLPHEPLIRLERGQTARVPRPQRLQVLHPEGTCLQILEANPERVRVMAV